MGFKRGDIVYHGWSDGRYYITEVTECTKDWIKGMHCLWIKQEKFQFEDNYQNNIGNEIRLATNEEIGWFNECVKNRKYMPFNNKQYYEIY